MNDQFEATSSVQRSKRDRTTSTEVINSITNGKYFQYFMFQEVISEVTSLPKVLLNFLHIHEILIHFINPSSTKYYIVEFVETEHHCRRFFNKIKETE